MHAHFNFPAAAWKARVPAGVARGLGSMMKSIFTVAICATVFVTFLVSVRSEASTGKGQTPRGAIAHESKSVDMVSGGVSSATQKKTTAYETAATCASSYPSGSPPGDRLQHPQIIYVNWQGAVSSPVDSMLPRFYQDIVNSDYIDDLNVTYTLGGVTYAGRYVLNPSQPTLGCTQATPCTLTDQTIQNELQLFTSENNLPTSGTIYMIHLPENYMLLDQTNSQQCAYHGAIQQWLGTGYGIVYGVMSDWGPGSFCASGRFPDTGTSMINNVTMAASHELIEAWVDPSQSWAWHKAGNYEVGDPCECPANEAGGVPWTLAQGSTHQWFVQQIWNGWGQWCMTETPTPPSPFGAAINSSSFAVTKAPSDLDEFWSATNGTLSTAWWGGGNWNNFDIYTNGPVAQGSSIAATARTANNIDLFYVGMDGALYTSAWPVGNPNNNGGWGTWPLTGTGWAPPGAPVSAVTRGPNMLDVFWVDGNGDLLWASWAGGDWAFSQAGVSGRDGLIRPGASVAAVARTSQNLDVFFAGPDGGIWTTFLYPGWTSWGRQEIPGTQLYAASGGAGLAATARTWVNLDLFYMNNGQLIDASWRPEDGWVVNPTNAWVTNGVLPVLSAVTRDYNTKDVFFVDGNGPENVSWHSGGHWNFTTLESSGAWFNPGEPIAVSARTPYNLDVFDLVHVGSMAFPVSEYWYNGAASWGVVSPL
jgi:hypothetical protein